MSLNIQALADEVTDRIASLREQRLRTLRAIQGGAPLQAEPDPIRQQGRIERALGVAKEIARTIVAKGDLGGIPLDTTNALLRESLQGETVDFVGVSFLEQAIAAARTVARIIRSNGAAVGTGFLISDQLLLTNNHVIGTKSAARTMLAQFEFEIGIDGSRKQSTTYFLDPQRFWVTDDEDDLDYTVVGLGRRRNGPRQVADLGFCPLRADDTKHMMADFVNIVQHPQGEPKQVALRENRLVARGDHVLHYVADTESGSSGSPVFNDEWEVVALHHWGSPHRETEINGRPVDMFVNEGIRISSIVHELRQKLTTLSATQRQLIVDALAAPERRTFGGPASVPVVEATDVLPTMHEPIAEPKFGPQLHSDGTVRWTLPLEVSMKLGGIRAIGTHGRGNRVNDEPLPQQFVGRSDDRTPQAERVVLDPNYENRNGYDAEHLSGQTVKLPRMLKRLRVKAAPLIVDDEVTDALEVHYQNFSLVMHRIRRLAVYTAVNIDGESWIHIFRETGLPKEFSEASEKWFDDVRIAADHRTDQSLYDDQTDDFRRRVFDRGHLVRRQDPAWGTDSDAIRANADTFHFTNCVPQESQFNQRLKHWQGLEKYLLESATEDDVSITVFTGPVFGVNDPEYRDIQVPLRFWKILVRVEDGELLATAFVADQSSMVLPHFDDAESAFDDDFDEVGQYQVPIKEIEQLTDLRFDSLKNQDTFRASDAESASGIIPIRDQSDIQWR